jgi:hypothetical protein
MISEYCQRNIILTYAYKQVSPIYIAPGEMKLSDLKDVLEARNANSLIVINDSELVTKATAQLRKVRRFCICYIYIYIYIYIYCLHHSPTMNLTR